MLDVGLLACDFFPPAPPPETIATGDNLTVHRRRLLSGLINEYCNAA
jgi:hypothetical protein